MIDFATWMANIGYDRMFRLLIKRRVGDWTPYEWDKKFIDADKYEDNHYRYVRIVEAIELPDKDILLGYKEFYDESCNEAELPIEYKKLSEVELSFFPCDMEDIEW